MNWTVVQNIALVACCVSAMGCTICQQARRTLWQEPAAYSWKHDRRRSAEAYLRWANAELAEEASRCPDLFGDPDYIMGFRDGFVDFVWAGGTGEPPPIPPRQFWNVMLRSPNGKARANLWFDGYRHGAAVARDGGYRDLGRVHSSLVGFTSQREQLPFLPMLEEMAAPDAPQARQEGEVLPEPPAAAPSLPSPFESGDAPADDAAADPAAESVPASTPVLEETPFQDDPQAPAAETGDQPLSMDAAPSEQHVNPQHEATANQTSLHEPQVGEFDGQRAILLEVKQENGNPHDTGAKSNHAVSTLKFVEVSDSETNSIFSCSGQESVQLEKGSNLESNSAGNQPVSTVKFVVESSDCGPKSKITYRRALQNLTFGGWTRSGTCKSESNSQLRVLDE